MNESAIVVKWQKSEEGGFTAWIEGEPGAVSQGETIVEAVENAFDAWREVRGWQEAKK